MATFVSFLQNLRVTLSSLVRICNIIGVLCVFMNFFTHENTLEVEKGNSTLTKEIDPFRFKVFHAFLVMF